MKCKPNEYCDSDLDVHLCNDKPTKNILDMIEMDGSGFTFNSVILKDRYDHSTVSTIQPNMIDRSDFCHHCDLLMTLEDDDQHYFKNHSNNIGY